MQIMKRFTTLAFLTLALLSCQKQEGLPPEVTSLLEKTRQAYAPDKRVALFDISAEQEGGKVVLNGESNLPEALRSLEESLQAAGFTTVNRIKLLPDPLLDGKTFGVVQLSACNIRSEPRHSAELSTQSTLGAPLRVLKESEGWFLVQTPDGYLGWPEAAPFARILLTAAPPRLPEGLLGQLAEGGLLVAPLGAEGGQRLTRFRLEGDRAYQEDLGACAFVPMLSRTVGGAAGQSAGAS